MARSIGEAIATGVDLGYSRVQDYNDRRERKARQETLDQQAQADRGRTLERQADADQTAALQGQASGLRAEVEASQQPGAAPLSPERKAQIGTQASALQEQQQNLFVKRGGVDFKAIEKRNAERIEAMKTGKFDIESVPVNEFGPLFIQATGGHSPKSFLRGPNGEPSEIERGIQQFMAGAEAENSEEALAGANTVFRPSVDRLIGQKNPHGEGKVVGARIERLVPDPNSPKDDPRVIPMLRVFVNSGKEFRGPLPKDAPPGATGYYLAPITEGRSTDRKSDDKTKSISIQHGMDFMQKYAELAEGMNTPQVRQRIEEAYATPGSTPDDWLKAKALLGVKSEPAITTTEKVIPADATLLRTQKDAQGNIIGEQRISGNAKSTGASKVGTTQEKINAIDLLVENGDLTEEEGAAAKHGVVKTVSTPKASGRGGAPTEDKKLGRMLQSLKEDRLGLEKKKDIVLAEYKAEIQDAPRKRRDEARTAFDAKMAKLNEQDDSIKRKMDEIDKKLDLGGEDGEKPAGKAAAAPTGPQPNRMKFDKQGNMVK